MNQKIFKPPIEWILKIAKSQDLAINSGHLMDFGSVYFEIKVLYIGQITNDMASLTPIAHDCLLK